jgi:hypothetical protein
MLPVGEGGVPLMAKPEMSIRQQQENPIDKDTLPPDLRRVLDEFNQRFSLREIHPAPVEPREMDAPPPLPKRTLWRRELARKVQLGALAKEVVAGDEFDANALPEDLKQEIMRVGLAMRKTIPGDLINDGALAREFMKEPFKLTRAEAEKLMRMFDRSMGGVGRKVLKPTSRNPLKSGVMTPVIGVGGLWG